MDVSTEALEAFARLRSSVECRYRWPLKPRRSALEPGDLAILDNWAKTVVSRTLSHRQPDIGPAVTIDQRRASTLLSGAPGSLGLAAILSFSGNGCVRELAVRTLTSIGPRGLPFLVLRCKDWVQIVAFQAQSGLSRLLSEADDDSLAATLVQVPRLPPLGIPASMVRTVVEERAGFLARVRKRLPESVQAWALDNGWYGVDEDRFKVLLWASSGRSPLIVRFALKAVLELPDEEQEMLVDSLFWSKARMSRYTAVAFAIRFGRPDILWNAIDDGWWRIRSKARFELQATGEVDFVEHYRVLLPSPTAVAGFGEVAPDKELALLLPLLRSESREVKIEVLRMIAYRSLPVPADEILPALRDRSASVARAAVTVLRTRHEGLSATTLEELWAGATVARRRTLVPALQLVSPWDRLELALRWVAVREISGDVVANWLDRSRQRITRPSEVQLRRCEAFLADARPMLKGQVANELDVELRYWKPKAR